MFNSMWFKCWALNRQLCWYLDLITEHVYNGRPLDWQVWALFVLQVAFCLQCFLLSLPGNLLDEYSRLLIGDHTLFNSLPQGYNLIIAAFPLLSLYLLYVLFWTNFSANNFSKFLSFKLVNEVLYKNKGDGYFFQKYMNVKRCGRVKTTTFVKKQLYYYQLMTGYFILGEGIYKLNKK